MTNSTFLDTSSFFHASLSSNKSVTIFLYGTLYASSFSSIVPGKNPMSLVGTADRTMINFSCKVSLFRTSCNARYVDIKVLPVPAEPDNTKLNPSFQELNAIS